MHKQTLQLVGLKLFASRIDMSLSTYVKFKGMYLPGYMPETTPILNIKRRIMTVVPAGEEWSRYKFYLSNQAENDLVVANDIANRGLFLLQNVNDTYDIVYDYAQRSMQYASAAVAATAGISYVRIVTRGAGYQPPNQTVTLDDAAPDAWAASAGGSGAEVTVFINLLGQLYDITLTDIGSGYTVGTDFAIDFSGITHPIGSNATGLFNVVAGTNTIITSVGHGLSNGDYVWLYNGSGTGAYDGGYHISDVTTDTFVIPKIFGPDESGYILTPRLYTYRLKPGEFAFFRSGQGAQELYGMADGKNVDDEEERPMCDLICVEE